MGSSQAIVDDRSDALLALYDRAVGDVFGYLISRCRDTGVAEDLTSETFLAAVTAVQQDRDIELSVAWLIGVARHKLLDHWRRAGRRSRNESDADANDDLAAVAAADADADWTDDLEPGRAITVLRAMPLHHRMALTLRYVDDPPVAEVAEHLGRTLHATEALLVRARIAFRRAYAESCERGDDAR